MDEAVRDILDALRRCEMSGAGGAGGAVGAGSAGSYSDHGAGGAGDAGAGDVGDVGGASAGARLGTTGELSAADVDRIIRAHSKRAHDGRRIFAKKHLLVRYLQVKREGGPLWRSWRVDDELDARFLRTMQMKPRRTASGVATITVLTKPWPCANSCVYCPNDPRMPKSYLSDEPACQRAERNLFHPYLQVASRLHTLQQMGHDTGKVELIVLGGTWLDYPADYRVWFAGELFRALNDSDEARERALFAVGEGARARKAAYAGNASEIPAEAWAGDAAEAPAEAWAGDATDVLAEAWAGDAADVPAEAWAGDASEAPAEIGAGEQLGRPVDETAVRASSGCSPKPLGVHFPDGAPTPEELAALQAANERAAHRVVGLVVETRPDTITCEALRELRRLGCTKVQMGVQSIDERILQLNGRHEDLAQIRRAFELTRLFGFKTHAHFMVNLLGATPESDVRDYRAFANDPAFSPDEVKLYPCALVAGTRLVDYYEDGSWRPYTERELLDVLCDDMLATPPFMRVSRMIRDISAKDILVGNKKTNLRQLVDAELAGRAGDVQEIRFREIGTERANVDELRIDEVRYTTTATDEVFLQWVTPTGKIAGFLRLSLPHREALERCGDVPVQPDEAMIREVHVYGFATAVDARGESAQHRGLGRQLIERACDIARDCGYARLNVISAIGTREYYRRLGFEDHGLYQQKEL